MIKKITSAEKEESLPVTPKKPATTVKKAIASSDTINKEIKNTTPLTTVENEEKQSKKEKNKPQKIKGVRNKLTLSESDYVILNKLKKKCLDAGVHVKKRNLIRAGLLRLSKLNSTALLSAIAQVEIIKAEASDD
ncbi:MAG: hypothetical protein ABL887_06705 [Nitrosomonas sp.]|jgi:hypothetical protein